MSSRSIRGCATTLDGGPAGAAAWRACRSGPPWRTPRASCSPARARWRGRSSTSACGLNGGGARSSSSRTTPSIKSSPRIRSTTLGYGHEVAGSGVEAPEKTAGIAYDLILMDYQMPEMDGIETTRVIRGGAWLNADSPILCLTLAATSVADARRCLAAGMARGAHQGVADASSSRRALARHSNT